MPKFGWGIADGVGGVVLEGLEFIALEDVDVFVEGDDVGDEGRIYLVCPRDDGFRSVVGDAGEAAAIG